MTTSPKPHSVDDIEAYWNEPPPNESPRCAHWREEIAAGRWFPNSRISTLGYYGKAAFFGVYIWEYINVLSPLIDEKRKEKARATCETLGHTSDSGGYIDKSRCGRCGELRD